MRATIPVNGRDLVSASPHVDPVEFNAMWERLYKAYPDLAPLANRSPSPLTYVGYFAGNHYFSLDGNSYGYAVPCADGWKPKS